MRPPPLDGTAGDGGIGPTPEAPGDADADCFHCRRPPRPASTPCADARVLLFTRADCVWAVDLWGPRLACSFFPNAVFATV